VKRNCPAHGGTAARADPGPWALPRGPPTRSVPHPAARRTAPGGSRYRHLHFLGQLGGAFHPNPQSSFWRAAGARRGCGGLPIHPKANVPPGEFRGNDPVPRGGCAHIQIVVHPPESDVALQALKEALQRAGGQFQASCVSWTHMAPPRAACWTRRTAACCCTQLLTCSSHTA
jgi:hypothetical protein